MVTLIDLRRLLHALCARLAFAPPLLARLVIGVVFTHSGYGKWTHIDGFSEAVLTYIRESEGLMGEGQA